MKVFSLISITKKQLASFSRITILLSITSLVCAEIQPISTFALSRQNLQTAGAANSSPKASVRVSQGLRSEGSKASYDCGQAVVTITQQSQNRWIYQAVNARGQKLTIRNGKLTTHANVVVYNFDDGHNHIIFEDYGDNTAGLITDGNPNSAATYDCKLQSAM